MNILVTGGAGFIGSTLANSLSSLNKVVVIDDLSMGKVSNLVKNDNITFIQGSVTDQTIMEKLFKENEFDYIYHLAAVASVADSVARPIETHDVNFNSVLLLLELIRQYNPQLKRLVFASSAAVFGDEPTLPKQEESVIRPLTPYAIDKFAAEKYVLAYNHLYGVPTSAVRFFNVYGPNQNPSSPYSGVISIAVEQIKKSIAGKEVAFTIFGDGEQSRDFIYVNDVVKALKLVAHSDESKGEVFNVGTGNSASLNDLLALMQNLLNHQLPLKYEKERVGDIKHSYADPKKLSKIGFKNDYTLSSGMKDYLAHVFDQ